VSAIKILQFINIFLHAFYKSAGKLKIGLSWKNTYKYEITLGKSLSSVQHIVGYHALVI